MERTMEGMCLLPSEAVWDEDDPDALDPGSLPATRAVADMVVALGLEVGDFEIDQEHQRWTFDARGDGALYLIGVYHFGPEDMDFLVMVECETGPASATREKFAHFADALFERVASDPRFALMRWTD
jgi:hypothetical protein